MVGALYIIELLVVMSLLPLTVLLLLVPAAVPDESVIADKIRSTGPPT